MSGETIHASCVLIGEGAILIRGASGSGKSRLALALIDGALREGSFARLVGDDRIALSAQGGRLIGRGAPALAGRIEARGLGLLPIAHETAAVIRLVVDLAEKDGLRLPEPESGTIRLQGVALLRVTSRITHGLENAILRRYRALNDTLMIE